MYLRFVLGDVLSNKCKNHPLDLVYNLQSSLRGSGDFSTTSYLLFALDSGAHLVLKGKSISLFVLPL